MSIPEQRRPSEMLPLDVGAAVMGAILFNMQEDVPLPGTTKVEDRADLVRWVADYSGLSQEEITPHIPGICELIEDQKGNNVRN